mgnify:CR=1 FL=1
MASIPPQRLTVDKIVKDLLEPATTSFYQVSISDPRQLNERGDTFATYLRQQGLEVYSMLEVLIQHEERNYNYSAQKQHCQVHH